MTESGNPIKTDLCACIEALLFVATGPVTINQLADALEIPSAEISSSLKQLDDRYQGSGGLRLQWHAERVQITTAPAMGPLIERFLFLDTSSKLSKAALETLAVISYQQPITRPKIDAIRGVSSDGVIRSLLGKGLIQEMGRAEGPGRPIMYGTTVEFLQNFGLNSIKDLPPLETGPEKEDEASKNQKILKD